MIEKKPKGGKIDFLFFANNFDLASMFIIDVVEVDFVGFFGKKPRVFFFLKHPGFFMVEASVKGVNFH